MKCLAKKGWKQRAGNPAELTQGEEDYIRSLTCKYLTQYLKRASNEGGREGETHTKPILLHLSSEGSGPISSPRELPTGHAEVLSLLASSQLIPADEG